MLSIGLVLLAFVLLGILANCWGVDSRNPLPSAERDLARYGVRWDAFSPAAESTPREASRAATGAFFPQTPVADR